MRVRHDMVCCYVVRPGPGGGSDFEFLQVRRASGDYMGGTWQTIYGTVESGDEPLWRAALRELREETGLVPREFYRLAESRTFYTPADETLWQVTPFCALVDRAATVTLNTEHTEVRWVARARVSEAFMWATDRASIEALCHDILDDGPAKPYLRMDLAGEL